MNHSDLKELLKAYGWFEIPSGNSYTYSFKKEEGYGRINFYHTRGTLVLQNINGATKTIRDIETLLEIENIITKI